jgi:ankyrin repeat protein
MTDIQIRAINNFLHNNSPELSRTFRFVLKSHSNPHVYQADEFNRTPIHYATILGAKSVLQFYLEHKLYNVNHIDCMGQTALWKAIHMGSSDTVDLIFLLMRNGANPNIPDACGITPLMHAVLTENPTLVNALIAAGANPTARIKKEGLFFRANDTALSLAVRLQTLDGRTKHLTSNQLKLIQLLVRYTKEPTLIFHAMQQTKNPSLRQYITECMVS